VYQLQFVTSLNASYRKRRELLPEAYESNRERGVSTVRQFDSRITAFYGGYRNAEDYYQQVSPGPRLEAIDWPVLILAAADDPFIPEASMQKWARSEGVSMEIVDGGGHVGFVGRSKAPGHFWAADRILAFVESLVRLRD
jgi:predicted alpha/beta-fold hydrolase